MVAVSVIVPVRDRAGSLDRMLRALATQTLDPCTTEVIVVDDGSRDDSAHVAESAGARVLRRPAVGSYAARNAGAEVAEGAVLAFADSDCVPHAEWLERGLRAVAQAGPIVAGEVRMGLPSRPSTAALIDLARHLDQRRNVEAGFGATANLFVERATFFALGGFADRLRTGGDLEFGRRARAAGLPVRYAPTAVVGHAPRTRPAKVAGKAFRIGRGRADLRGFAHAFDGMRTRIWTRPGAWFPGALLRGEPVYGQERIARLGHQPRADGDQIRLAIAEWALVQVPAAAGDLVGDLGRLGRRQ